jgi:hypothetical protein
MTTIFMPTSSWFDRSVIAAVVLPRPSTEPIGDNEGAARTAAAALSRIAAGRGLHVVTRRQEARSRGGSLARTVKILMQTTTPRQADDWSIDSFTLTRRELASIEESGLRFEVDARDRDTDIGTPDPVLSTLDESGFDELWLFALDGGDGLTEADCAGIARFRRRGGGILTTRDHEDVGASLCTLAGGAAHHFQTRNPEPDDERRTPDDTETPSISWPNYHSGRNGDCQTITVVEPAHQLVRRTDSTCGRIEFLPAHPHEGAVSAPPGDASARVIARGRSRTTGREFNLAVAFERSVVAYGNRLGRAVADSSFHHFADYNWDPALGCPSFVTEPVGDSLKKNPCAIADTRRYVRNLALWLAPEPSPDTIGGPR